MGAIDLRQCMIANRWRAIGASMDEYAVLVFRDQNFANEEQTPTIKPSYKPLVSAVLEATKEILRTV